MEKESKYDYSISLIRLIAMSFIITCHFMQFFDFELAWWFNVGVQMFLGMSGFLYGKRNIIENDFKFYKKSLLKILIDYYIVIISIIFLFALFCPDKLSLGTIVKVLLVYGTLEGGGHLWYIPYCLFCYLITPFLSRYFNNYKNKHIFIRFVILSIFAIVLIELFLNYFNSAWIFCYMLGFFLGHISKYDESKLYNKMSILIIAVALLSNFIQIMVDYIIKTEFDGIFGLLYSKFCNFAHVALGIMLFIVLKFIFAKVFEKGYPKSIKNICKYSDKYSYDIYLVHQFIILGPLSLMRLTGILGINIFLIMVIIVISTTLVNFTSNYLKSKLKKIVDI